MHLVPSQNLQRNRHRQLLREDEAIKLSEHIGLRGQQLGPSRPSNSDHIRQQLLRKPDQPQGTAPLGSAIVQQRLDRLTRHDLQHEPDPIQLRLRRGHNQDGGYNPSYRVAGRDQEELQED